MKLLDKLDVDTLPTHFRKKVKNLLKNVDTNQNFDHEKIAYAVNSTLNEDYDALLSEFREKKKEFQIETAQILQEINDRVKFLLKRAEEAKIPVTIQGDTYVPKSYVKHYYQSGSKINEFLEEFRKELKLDCNLNVDDWEIAEVMPELMVNEEGGFGWVSAWQPSTC